MIPASFDYVRPSSVDEAVAALAQAGEDAKVLGGGQSLLPVLRLRLAAPSMLVDIGGIAELRGIREDGDRIAIGAMTTHHEVMNDDLVRQHIGLVAKATATVADPQIRHMGTLGGSLAHADPAGDVGAAALALDAEMVIAGSGGRRTVPAAEFFVDYFTTAIGEGGDPHRGSLPALHRLGESLREDEPDRSGLADGLGGRGAPGRPRHDRRGPGRAGEHGADADPGERGRAGPGRPAGHCRVGAFRGGARSPGHLGSE